MAKPKREEIDESERITAKDEYSPAEAERRSEATLKRLISMPPKPHSAEPKRPRVHKTDIPDISEKQFNRSLDALNHNKRMYKKRKPPQSAD